MLWLQLPVLHKKYAYLGQLFLLSLGIHCLLLSALFFSFKTTGKHSLTIHSKVLTEAPIVFMPLQKVVHTSQAPKIQTKKVACAPKPQPQKKNPAKPIVAPQKLMEPKKVVQAQPKPLSSPKKVEEKKPIIEKKVEKKPEPKPEVVKQEAVPQPEVKQEVVHVGRDELMEITLQRHVIEQVKKVWQPPAGIAQDVCCSVYFSVDDEGKAMNVVMEQSSGSVLYDIGARNAILRAQFPVQARKKEFTVAFKP